MLKLIQDGKWQRYLSTKCNKCGREFKYFTEAVRHLQLMHVDEFKELWPNYGKEKEEIIQKLFKK